jgi:hypothetical protein
MRAGFGPHAVAGLYRGPAGCHLAGRPLCGRQIAPGLK